MCSVSLVERSRGTRRRRSACWDPEGAERGDLESSWAAGQEEEAERARVLAEVTAMVESMTEEEIEAVVGTLQKTGSSATPGNIAKAMEETRSFRGLATRNLADGNLSSKLSAKKW